MPVNLVQSSDIEAFFLQQAEGDAQIAQWLEMALAKSLRRRPESAVELTDLPSNAPGWLIYKWAQGGPFHRFSPDPELINKVGHIRDWLVEARASEAPFLRRKDASGNPLKLHNLDLNAAFNAASKYFERKSRKRVIVSDTDEETAMEFPDGFRVVELLTPQALDAEGKRMGHCVGSTVYVDRLQDGKERYYSLRDADGKPQVTMSVRSNGELDQCKAAYDARVDAECLSYLISFLTEKNLSLHRYHHDLPALFQETGGKIVHINDLPSSFTLLDKMYIRRDSAIEQLSERLFVNGSAHVAACPRLTRIGAELTVTRDLIVEDCEALAELPAGVIVGQQLKMRNCGLIALPDDLDVGSGVQLQNCKLLTSLGRNMRLRGNLQLVDCDNILFPEPVRVGGWLDINSARKQRLPGGLTVYGCFSLRHCDALESIGDGLTVTGNVFLGECPALKALPKRMRVKGDLTIANCGIQSLPDDLVVGGKLVIRDCPKLVSVAPCTRFPGPFEFRNCARLESLPSLPPDRELKIYACPSLGSIVPPHLLAHKYLRTDMFLDRDSLNG